MCVVGGSQETGVVLGAEAEGQEMSRVGGGREGRGRKRKDTTVGSNVQLFRFYTIHTSVRIPAIFYERERKRE